MRDLIRMVDNVSTPPQLNESPFGDAFKAARKAGNTQFTWNGKSFHTRQKGESPDKWKAKMLSRAAKIVPKPIPNPGQEPLKAPVTGVDRRELPPIQEPRKAPVAGVDKRGVPPIKQPNPAIPVSLKTEPPAAKSAEKPVGKTVSNIGRFNNYDPQAADTDSASGANITLTPNMVKDRFKPTKSTDRVLSKDEIKNYRRDIGLGPESKEPANSASMIKEYVKMVDDMETNSVTPTLMKRVITESKAVTNKKISSLGAQLLESVSDLFEDELTEISKEKVMQYADKLGPEMKKLSRRADKHFDAGENEEGDKVVDKIMRRVKGRNLAKDKISGRAEIPATGKNSGASYVKRQIDKSPKKFGYKESK